MTKHMMTILVLFILALGSGGCASQSGSDFVSDAFRRGAQLEQQGQYFRAAEAYLVSPAVAARETGRPVLDLSRIIDQAITEKLSSATALEAELRLDEAVAEMDAARRLLQRSASFDVESGQASLVESRRSQLVDRRVQALLVEAARAREGGLWSAALANLQRVETLSPGYGQTRERMREVWVDWADANESEGRLRAAADAARGGDKGTGRAVERHLRKSCRHPFCAWHVGFAKRRVQSRGSRIASRRTACSWFD